MYRERDVYAYTYIYIYIYRERERWYNYIYIYICYTGFPPAPRWGAQPTAVSAVSAPRLACQTNKIIRFKSDVCVLSLRYLRCIAF